MKKPGKGRKSRPHNTSDLAGEAPQSSGVAAKRKMPEGRRFKAGQSGNPGGKPKSLLQIQQLARSFATEAVETLASLMRTSRSPKIRALAAQALLDRGYGRPPQALAIASLDGRKVPTFGVTLPADGPGSDPSPRLLSAPRLDQDDVEVSGAGFADDDGWDSPALSAPDSGPPSPQGPAGPAAPAVLADDGVDPPPVREPVVVDAQTEQVAPLRLFEQLGRPAPPDLHARTCGREAAAVRLRAETEARIERENAEAREQQRVRQQRMRDQGWED